MTSEGRGLSPWEKDDGPDMTGPLVDFEPDQSGRVSHPDFCSCAIPCRSCGHESEQHAGSMWYGTGPRRCRVDGCNCKGCYIGSTPARCKEAQDV